MVVDDIGAQRLAQLRALTFDVDSAAQESWQRSADGEVDLASIGSTYAGNVIDPRLEACAVRLIDDAEPVGPFSIVVTDHDGVVRARRDGDPQLGLLLDALTLSPGYDLSEPLVGTTAIGLALRTGRDATLPGPAHYHPQLACIAEAASVVSDPDTEAAVAAVAVLAPSNIEVPLLSALAQSLARELARLLAADATRTATEVLQDFLQRSRSWTGWHVATDGEHILVGDAAARLEPADLRYLIDSVEGALMLQDFENTELALPSGVAANVAIVPIAAGGRVIGAHLTAAPRVRNEPSRSEAARRQGAHVMSGRRRDFRLDLTTPFDDAPHSARQGAVSSHPHGGAGVHGDLMTPYLRARRDVASHLAGHRNLLVVGEAGSGKLSVVATEFQALHPEGRILTASCDDLSGDTLPFRSIGGALFHGTFDDGPRLLVIRGLESLSPVGARRLDEILRPLAQGPTPPQLVGTVNDAMVDASRPYGLLLRYFHETVRVPPLRMRADDIAELSLDILRRLSGGRSLRLSHQAIRVLEGYTWPGNVRELEDVLRYIVSHKRVGEIQARDLPQVCFNGSPRRLTMLEAAQCDAIIQALYESKGNRYKAAAALGIARSSLYRKIDAFGISYIA